MKPYYLINNDVCVCCGAFVPEGRRICRECEQGIEKGKPIKASLLDLMSIQMGCNYLPDLRFLDHTRRAELAEKVRNLPARDTDLHDWNDALHDLTGDDQPRATEVTAGSHARAWWSCEEGHVWKAPISRRAGVQKSGCPVCSGRVSMAKRRSYDGVPEEAKLEAKTPAGTAVARAPDHTPNSTGPPGKAADDLHFTK